MLKEEALHQKEELVKEQTEKLNACRKRTVSVKAKSVNSRFCDYCEHLAEVNDQKVCQCCGKTVRVHQNYSTLRARFQEIISDNQAFMEGNMRFPSKPENRASFWVKNGLYTYKIDVMYFIRFMDLPLEQADDKYERFFQGIEKDCPRIIM